MSVKDAIMSLIDGRIRHEWQRYQAERTPNVGGIHWQKAGLRTGESQDHLRRLLGKAGSKFEGDFDALNLRIEDLQESIKRIREYLVRSVRAFRVNKFGEETQELRLRLRGGGGELRLPPPCGYSLADCVCGASSSPPPPVHAGSLGDAIEAARKAAAAATAAAALEDDEEGEQEEEEEEEEEEGSSRKRGFDVAAGAAAGGDPKRRRGEREGGGDGGRGAGQRGGGAPAASANSDDVPVDEIKSQTGKNALGLARRRAALEEETKTGARGVGGKRSSDGGGVVSRGRAASREPAEDPEHAHDDDDDDGGGGRRGVDGCGGGGGAHGDDDAWANGGDGEEGGEDEEEDEEDWQDALLGMQPHERAEAFEGREMFAEALRWHRQDLEAARACVVSGDEEEERGSVLDLARALRNTGRCLGKLGNSGYAESKKCLTEARELVGHGGPYPSPPEEQDLVLELGNLMYSRYVLCDEQGVRFLADEALEAALEYYRESRELCVDVVADSVDAGFAKTSNGGVSESAAAAAAAAAAATASGCLLRAEYNVGMSLFEQEKRRDAEGHLSAAVKIFRRLFAAGGGAQAGSTFHPAAGGGEGEGAAASVGAAAAAAAASTLDAWKAAARKQEGLSGLGGVYASSLYLLGECLASSCVPSSALEDDSRQGREKIAAETLRASAEAFLYTGDHSRALPPLLMLVEVLRRRLAGGAGRHHGEEDERKGGEPDGRGRAHAPEGRTNSPQQQQQGHAAGEVAGASPSSPAPFRRVGPVPTSAFAQRRRRARVARGGGGGGRKVLGKFPGDRSATSSAVTTVSSSRQTSGTAVGAAGAQAPRGVGEGVVATGGGGFGGSAGGEGWVAGDGGGSFAGLRAAAAAQDESTAVSAAAEGRARGDEVGGRDTALSKYLEKCHHLQEKPNPLACARLAQAEHRGLDTAPAAAAAAAAAAVDPACDGDNTHRHRSPPAPHQALDLGACRLTDRELRVLLHVLSRGRGGVGPDAAVAAASSGGGGDAPMPSPRLGALVLNGNPGIGAGALRELCGGGGGGSGRGMNASRNGSGGSLFSSLLRLELSACRLTAADLEGFSSNGAGPPSFDQTAAATVCLRALVLRDNPLTRLRERGPVDGGNEDEDAWIEPARKGTVALQHLIARAPSLEVLDVSGCSQIPDGPVRRLYSPQVSDLLASALSAGLEARVVAGKLAAATGAGRVADGSGGDGGNDERSESDGRAQVSTLRMGNNRFSRESWGDVLEVLSSNPPRELDLSFASVLPGRSAATADGVVTTATAAAVALPPVRGGNDDSPGAVTPPPRPAPPAQTLGELLAATVLPADAPGVETLNLTGSTGLLLLDDRRRQQRREVDGGGGVEDSSAPLACPSSSGMEAFLLLLRDTLMSPLCETTHLLLSGVRGPPPPPPARNNVDCNSAAPGGAPPSPPPAAVFGPRDAKSLCEAASACASLRCLDLAGCDLSGPVGAAAAAAAVSCLISNHDEDEVGLGMAGGRLRRLSLRACALGAAGLAVVVRALVAEPGGGSGPGTRRKGRSLPKLLDLSDNRPLAGAAVGTARPEQDGGLGEADLTELAGLVRVLEREFMVSVAVTRDQRRAFGRYASPMGSSCITPPS
ncbi:hypothetical protein Esi_0121_0054 [Ectocarpus siliculosus]|uniref:Uncharacterized protein n=1 Tax=Ectocarpus siliculosus TaxID=2880 RepID=D8LDQ0_ECTSI|nr:hypothetical protein Esi_0121_0054 [Ectocarpus siliculosus]|eukprot:CBN78457.1 hypothetical protein Esi_0121_0054 [Ectocarpus siliculosus]